MKKTISILLTIILLVSGLFILTGCNNETENAGPTKGGVNLKFDFTHQNKTIYNAHFDLASVFSIYDFSEDSPETVTIENKNENYLIDLTLDIEAKEAIEQQRNSAKEKENYTETKFGKYDGFYCKANGEFVAHIMLDTKDDLANAYILVGMYDESDEEKDILDVFKSSNVQKLLNNISFSTKTN